MGKGKGKAGGGGFRLFPGWFKSGASNISPHANDILRRVAIARGLRDSDHLLVCLGKQGQEISSDDAFKIMANELGHEAVKDYVFSRLFSDREMCEYVIQSYKKSIEELGEDDFITRSKLQDLKKYCGYSKKAE